MARVQAACAILLAALCASGHATAPKIDWYAVSRLERCDQLSPRIVDFAGRSENLAACLDGLKVDGIDELRITSVGGDAWKTLELAQRIRGRLDLLTVDTICAASCAAYLIPAAKRLRVLPHSDVFLRTALTLRYVEQLQGSLDEALHKRMPHATEAELARAKQQAHERMLENLARQLPAQAQFERETLGCHDWLDVNGHRPALPEGRLLFRVTPEMAARCLKTTQVTTFWSASSTSRVLPNLGIDHRHP
jgi:hypothetical protein